VVFDPSPRQPLLLDLNGQVYALDDVGSLMLARTLAAGPQAAVEAVTETYRVEPERARSDLEAFLLDLRRRGLIRPAGERPRRLRAALAFVALAPLLWSAHRFGGRHKAGWLLALAYLGTAFFGWGRTLAAWRRWHRRGPTPPVGPPEAEARAVDQAVRGAAAASWLPVECKERALAAWSLLRARGLAATLTLGIRPFPVAGHCWTQAGGVVVGDDPEYCAAYTPVVQFN
jgi:hypothetical protein